MQNEAGRFLKIPNTIIVTKTFTGFEELILGSHGDAPWIWEFFEKLFEAVICNDGSDGGLLQHDFRDENLPGVPGASPWPVFAFALKPLDERGSKRADVFDRLFTGRFFLHRYRLSLCGREGLARVKIHARLSFQGMRG